MFAKNEKKSSKNTAVIISRKDHSILLQARSHRGELLSLPKLYGKDGLCSKSVREALGKSWGWVPTKGLVKTSPHPYKHLARCEGVPTEEVFEITTIRNVESVDNINLPLIQAEGTRLSWMSLEDLSELLESPEKAKEVMGHLTYEILKRYSRTIYDK